MTHPASLEADMGDILPSEESWMDMFVDGYDPTLDDVVVDDAAEVGRSVKEDFSQSPVFGEWRSKVERRRAARVGKDLLWEQRFRGRCGSVEWRSSTVLDGEGMVDRILGLFGGECSFALAREGRGSRADYLLVFRRKDVGWLDWGRKFGFGHGEQPCGEPPFMRFGVASNQSAEGTNKFTTEMLAKCETYGEVWTYRKEGIIHVPSRSKTKANYLASRKEWRRVVDTGVVGPTVHGDEV